MRKNVLVRSIAVVSGLAVMASLAACGDNTAASTSTDSGSTSSTITGEYQGAGSSAQEAAVEAWIAGYTEKNPDVKVAYNPTGSGAGVSTFLTGATAWAGSDASLSADQVTQSSSVCASGTAFDPLPGLISDTLFVSKKAMEEKPEAIQKLINAWGPAIDYYNENTEDAQAIIAKNIGSDAESLKTAFEGVEFYGLEENKTYLNGEFKTDVLPSVQESSKNAGIVKDDHDPDEIIDTQFVDAAE